MISYPKICFGGDFKMIESVPTTNKKKQDNYYFNLLTLPIF